MRTILKLVACGSLLWLAFYTPASSADTYFLQGMLTGMGDSIVSHPAKFATMGDVASYRDRVVERAREVRGNVDGSQAVGDLVGDRLNQIPFVLNNDGRSQVSDILKKAAGDL